VPDIPKNDPEALRRALSGNAYDAHLALITCGSDFNPTTGPAPTTWSPSLPGFDGDAVAVRRR